MENPKEGERLGDEEGLGGREAEGGLGKEESKGGLGRVGSDAQQFQEELIFLVLLHTYRPAY